jgi:N-methylhydantoinase B
MTTVQPIEAVEQLYPLRVERTALREDSGGAGLWRGGLGLVREVRVRVGGARLSVLAEKAVLPPFGVRGGGAGARNAFWVRRGGARVDPSPLPGKVGGFPLLADDVVVMESSGGGGFGDPLEREPVRVLADLAQGYVTEAAARDAYGVVLAGGAVDPVATRGLREALRGQRTSARLTAAPDLDAAPRRTIRLDAGTAARLGLGPGTPGAPEAVVELVNPRGAPLRAWVGSVPAGDGRRAEVPAVVLRMLGLAEGAEVELRLVHLGALGRA